MSNPKAKGQASSSLEPIPDKLYFSIGEVSTLCDLRPHVLRYWEQEFPQLAPSKRRGNRRYYQRKDVVMVRQIRDLLYNQGYTIEGARQQLMTEVVKKQPGATKMESSIQSAIASLQEVSELLSA